MTDTLDLVVVRSASEVCEYRSDTESLGLMDVRFSPFDVWYEVDSFWEGNFLERSAPGAFKRTIGQHNDKNSAHRLKTLYNHGMDFTEGDKLLGDVVDYVEEKDSPRSTVALFDAPFVQNLLPGIRSGAYGSSFMFRVRKDEWNNEPEPSDHNPAGIPERTLKEVHVFEAGPVTWPANPSATTGLRCDSSTDLYYERLAARDPARVETLRSKITALRDAGRLAVGARLLPALAPQDPDDSAARRSTGLAMAKNRRRYFEIKGSRS